VVWGHRRVQQCLERGDSGSILQEDHSQADTLGFPCVRVFAHVLVSMYVCLICMKNSERFIPYTSRKKKMTFCY